MTRWYRGAEAACEGQTIAGHRGKLDRWGVLVVDAESEAAIRARLAEDPWASDMLTIESVRRWSVWIRAEVRP